MKIIVAGSRTITDYEFIKNCVMTACNDLSPDESIEIVSGTANGVDKIGEIIASNYRLKVHRFPADWNTHGKSAGYKRNQQMADFADALIAIWDGKSKGTQHMIDIMEKTGKQIWIFKKESKYDI